jgi:hypothetical protein
MPRAGQARPAWQMMAGWWRTRPSASTRGDVVSVQAGAEQAGLVGKVAAGFGKGGRAGGPVQGAGGLAYGGAAALLQGKGLGQHGAVARQGLGKDGVLRLGGGENDVQHLLAGAGLGELVDQAGLRGARPGPGADFGEAAFVHVDDDEAALITPACAQRPGQSPTRSCRAASQGPVLASRRARRAARPAGLPGWRRCAGPRLRGAAPGWVRRGPRPRGWVPNQRPQRVTPRSVPAAWAFSKA